MGSSRHLPPANSTRPDDCDGALALIAPLAEAIVALLHPSAEVAVHEVSTDRIVAIWNPISRRRVGDPALLGEIAEWESRREALIEESASGGRPMVIGPYEKIGIDGHRISSVSVPTNDGRFVVCINLDRHALDSAVEAITRFAAALHPQPTELFERDWRENISAVIDDWTRRHGFDRSRLARAQRIALIGDLDAKGLFATRGAARHVAHALSVSRATVYSLLQEARA
jgi:D-arginine utilization repressor